MDALLAKLIERSKNGSNYEIDPDKVPAALTMNNDGGLSAQEKALRSAGLSYGRSIYNGPVA